MGMVTNFTSPATSIAIRSAVGNMVHNPSDYNKGLQNADASVIAAGNSMKKGGGMAAVSGLAVAATSGTASLAVVDAPVTIPVATGGLVVGAVGSATSLTGTVLEANGSINAAVGYNYGNKSENEGKGKNNLKPSPDADGPHSSFKVDKDGKITNTTTYEQNPQNPTGFDEVKRVDVQGKAHDGVETPHVHEPKKQVRPATPEELPRQ